MQEIKDGVKSPVRLGSGAYLPAGPAPGSFVLDRGILTLIIEALASTDIDVRRPRYRAVGEQTSLPERADLLIM